MHKVFFAHPDPKFVALYRQRLRPHFAFDSAHDGLAALRQIRLLRPDLIVSDFHLPLLSGLSLLRYVRRDSDIFATPFIFLSDHPDAAEALGAGATEWLNREESLDTVLEKIYRHIKINQERLAQIKSYGI